MQTSSTLARLVAAVFLRMEEKKKQEGHFPYQNKSLPNLQEMILEYAWTHKMKDLQEVVDTSLWMEPKQQYYTLKEPWRLRVASAQAYSIIKKRDVGRYERVISFMEASYRLLSTLVVAIKHMKILFGLKTVVIMWMLKQGQGIVPIVVKILQFFPGELPQYQNHCSNREMSLMRKNHLDFKLFAQSLAMDKKKLENYIQNQMEEQYGEHYAQKVEDRLLHYLHVLEMMLPGDTYLDQLLRKEHPVSYEDKLLLEVIAQGSMPIATSLRTLLQQAAAVVEPVHLTEVAVNNVSNGGPPGSETATGPEMMLEDTTRKPKAACRHLSQDSPLLFDCGVGGCEVGCPKPKEGLVREDVDREAMKKGDCDYKKKGPANHTKQEEGDGCQGDTEAGEDHKDEQLSQRSGDYERVASSSSSSSSSSSFLQFCSKHQRWVRSILFECSEELQTQSDVASAPSPLLLPSSSSSSSKDLTPSDLIPCDLIQKPATSPTSSLNQATAQGPGPTPPMYIWGSGPAEKHPLANSTQTHSVHPLCSSKGRSAATAAPNPSHSMASHFPCTLVHEPEVSDEAPTFSPPKPEAQPQMAPAIAVPMPEQRQQALAPTLPAHYQQTVCVSRSSSPSATAYHPPTTLSPGFPVSADEQTSRPEMQPPRRRNQVAWPLLKEGAACPDLLNSHRLCFTLLLQPQPETLLNFRSTLAGAVSTPTDRPPLSISAQEDLRALSQFRLQPYVRLTRLHPQQYLREAARRSPPSTETQLVEKQASDAVGDPNDEGGEEEEEGGGGEKRLYFDFDPNLHYSSDDSSSGSDSGDCKDPDYIPGLASCC
ncbi:unnamed protein product [Merluccius merluccius]